MEGVAEVVERTEREFFETRVCVEGLFGRNRKPKQASWAVAETAARPTVAEVLPAAQAKLAEMRVRVGVRYRVYVGARTEEVTRFADGSGMRGVGFRVAGDACVFEGVVE